MTDPVAFGRHIEQLREAARINRATAARRAGVTGAYWGAIESGIPQGRGRRPTMPRVPVVRAIADALDADKAELLEFAGYADDAALERARIARLGRQGALGGILSTEDVIAAETRIDEDDRRLLLAALKGMVARSINGELGDVAAGGDGLP